MRAGGVKTLRGGMRPRAAFFELEPKLRNAIYIYIYVYIVLRRQLTGLPLSCCTRRTNSCGAVRAVHLWLFLMCLWLRLSLRRRWLQLPRCLLRRRLLPITRQTLVVCACESRMRR